MPTVVPSVFSKRNQEGDFKWMIEQYKYDDCLFIFNENIEWYEKSFASQGNACIRNYNQFGIYDPPRAMGVITGTLKNGGFTSLDEKTKKYINYSIDEIKKVIKKYKYKKVYYSAEEDGLIGTSIFKVDATVIQYITDKLVLLKYL